MDSYMHYAPAFSVMQMTQSGCNMNGHELKNHKCMHAHSLRLKENVFGRKLNKTEEFSNGKCKRNGKWDIFTRTCIRIRIQNTHRHAYMHTWYFIKRPVPAFRVKHDVKMTRAHFRACSIRLCFENTVMSICTYYNNYYYYHPIYHIPKFSISKAFKKTSHYLQWIPCSVSLPLYAFEYS